MFWSSVAGDSERRALIGRKMGVADESQWAIATNGNRAPIGQDEVAEGVDEEHRRQGRVGEPRSGLQPRESELDGCARRRRPAQLGATVGWCAHVVPQPVRPSHHFAVSVVAHTAHQHKKCTIHFKGPSSGIAQFSKQGRFSVP